MVNLAANMSIVTAGLYVVSMFTSGIYIGRMPIYTSLYSYILLPWIFEHAFNERSKKLMYALTCRMLFGVLLLSDACDVGDIVRGVTCQYEFCKSLHIWDAAV